MSRMRSRLDALENQPPNHPCCHDNCDCDPEVGHAGELMVATMNAMTTPPDCPDCAKWAHDLQAYYAESFADNPHPSLVLDDPQFHRAAPTMPDCFIYPKNHGGIICEHFWYGGWCGAHQGKPAPKGWTGAHV
jgi:hypothetical protein